MTKFQKKILNQNWRVIFFSHNSALKSQNTAKSRPVNVVLGKSASQFQFVWSSVDPPKIYLMINLVL